VVRSEARVVDDRRGEGDRGGEERPRAPHNRIIEHTAHVRDEAQELASSIKDVSQDLGGFLAEQLERRPYAVLGVAAGFGWVLGGGLASRLTRTGLRLGARFGLGLLLRQVIEQQAAALTGGARSGEATEA
jgi:hypothetical protein